MSVIIHEAIIKRSTPVRADVGDIALSTGMTIKRGLNLLAFGVYISALCIFILIMNVRDGIRGR